MWFGRGDVPAPVRLSVSSADDVPIDTAIYAARADVGAILVGGGDFSRALAALGGRLPVLFDEQARHLGAFRGRCSGPEDLSAALRSGANVALVGGAPVCLGMTPQRLALNAELFEKCAKAYALAFAAGGPTPEIPAWVRFIANRRLLKDERRARERFAHGLLPEDNNSY
jgi:ribulose-5-phosphate 4-epimerase/fuculose-1-phosphate aldolase